MKLAETMGMSLQETRSRISSSEFTQWKVYFRTEHQRFHREDYLFAMLASENRKNVVKHPEKVKLDHFLLDFGGKKQGKVESESGMSAQQVNDASKAAWMSFVGMDPNDPHNEKGKS